MSAIIVLMTVAFWSKNIGQMDLSSEILKLLLETIYMVVFLLNISNFDCKHLTM